MSPVELLIAFDGSMRSEAAIRTAGALFPRASATVLNVYSVPVSTGRVLRAGAMPSTDVQQAVEELLSETRGNALAVAETGAKLAEDCGLDAKRAVRGALPSTWRSIAEEARVREADLIVAGARGLGALGRAFLGSTTTSLLHSAIQPILVVPGETTESRGSVMIGYDGSKPARHAIRTAGVLLPGRRAVVVHAWRSPLRHSLSGRALQSAPLAEIREITQDFDEEMASTALETAEEGASLANSAGLDAQAEAEESQQAEWHTVHAAAARHRALVLVTGSRGQGRAASAIFGSVSSHLVHNAERAILVVPPPVEPQDDQS